MFGRDPSTRDRLRPRFRPPTIATLVPNALTVAALCAGLTAVRFGLQERWDLAIFAVVVAGVFDGLDGRMARLLGGTSKFGAELDSLADFVSFGAVPAVLVYMSSLHTYGGIGWAVSLVYAVCCALRLARFNTAIGDPNPPPWANFYFVGVPAPGGAGLALLPMIATVEFGKGFFDLPSVNAVVLLAVGVLMVSRVPTFSIKRLRLTQDMMLPALLLVVLLAAAFASEPFLTFMAVGGVYLASIPVSVLMQARARRATAAMPPPALPAEISEEQPRPERAEDAGH